MADQLDTTSQYLRQCTLLVSDKKGNALDLSELHIKFSVKKSNGVTPNVADIRVYNLSDDTASQIQKTFKRVTLQAGYTGSFGVIFQGNIKQVIQGPRENGTETYIDIVAGDGDSGYNYAVVNQTLAKGATHADQINVSMSEFATKGVTTGYISDASGIQLPRGKVMFGNARTYMDVAAGSTDSTWSIQDEKVVFLKRSTYLPSQVVELNSKTGLVGAPQQTTEGINMKCLLNPKMIINGRVKINNADVQKYKIDFSVPGSPANIPVALTFDGVYFILVINHEGDNRGTPWYTNLVCLNISVSSNPLNSISAGY